jgi:organic radical activating enzyme
MSTEEIYDEIKQYNCKYIVFTGGEPFFQKNTWIVARGLWAIDPEYEVAVETNGFFYDHHYIGCFKEIVVSPKLDEITNSYLDTLKKWGSFATFKYVIRNEKDITDAKDISDFCKPQHSLLMPEGITKESQLNITWLIEKTKLLFPEAQVIPRLHIILYEGKRGI